jgi:hypothetical protein
LLNTLVCMAAIMLVQRAACLRQYISGAGYVAIAVMFGPFGLSLKILLLLGLTCVTAFSGLLAAFRTRPSPAVGVA